MARVVRPSVCLSVCLSHANISETNRDSQIDVWLLGNSNRNQGFPIENLPSDSRCDVQFGKRKGKGKGKGKGNKINRESRNMSLVSVQCDINTSALPRI